jgi:hypothetical protein
MRKALPASSICMACLGVALLTALPGSALDMSALTLEDQRVGGYMDGGRFNLADTSADGEVIHRMGAKWYIDRKIDEHWSVLANLHWMFWRNQATDLALFHIVGLKFDSDLQGSFTYDNGPHQVRLGLYEFKYNPDSRNLGEYLLRSEAYPTILENSQGKDLLAPAYSRVAGTEYGFYRDFYRARALMYAEQFNVPVNDVSFAFFGGAGPRHAEVEAGMALHRQFRFGKSNKATNLDPGLKAYVDSQGLTSQAIKLMVRGRLDLGENNSSLRGLTLYAEAALLGLKNDTLYYKDPIQRMPMMFGFTVPTGGFMETLGFELEYFKNPYYGRKYSIGDATASNVSPLPNLTHEEYDPARLPDYTKDDVRWSFLAHKALNKWLDLKFRVASDHLRLMGWDADYVGGEPMTKETAKPRLKNGWLPVIGDDSYFLLRIEYHN